jgi:hypothetical protein
VSHPDQNLFDIAYADAMIAWTKHLKARHTVRKSILFSGRIEHCRVCRIFKRKVKA